MTTRKSKPPFFRRFKVYILSVLAGLAASGAALILLSLVVFFTGLSLDDGDYLSLTAFGLGCLTAGFSAGTMKRQDGLASGVKAAGLFMLAVAAGGCVLGGFVGNSALNKVVVTVLCGAVGGVLGVNRNGGF